MNCPKCGFVQEERADCIRCGVVFAKFLAHYTAETTAVPEDPEQAPQFAGAADELQAQDAPDFAGLQKTLSDLQKRFSELEFERAERRRIRSEIRALDERLNLIATRQEEAERRIAESAPPLAEPLRNDIDRLASEINTSDLPSLRGRVDELEKRFQLGAEVAALRANSRAPELPTALEARLRHVEEHLAALAEARATAPAEGTPPQLETVFKTLDELKARLQNATVSQTEFGEVKKYQLMLRDMFESLRQSVEASAPDSAPDKTGRLAGLENGLAALCADVRKVHDRVKTLEAKAPASAQTSDPAARKELFSLKEEVLAVNRLHTEEQAHVRSEMTRLETELSNRLEALAQIPQKMESCFSQIQRLDQRYQPLSEIVDRLADAADGAPKQLAELSREFSGIRTELLEAKSRMQVLQERIHAQGDRPSLEASAASQGEICLIRENLDEIRRFITTLSQKL